MGTVPLWFLDERRLVKRQRKILDQLSDYEIRKNFGVNYYGAKTFCDFFDQLDGEKAHAIPLETKTLVFLSYLRSGNFQWSLGTLSGVSQSSVSRIISQFSSFTVSAAKNIISFPNTSQDRLDSKLGFYSTSGHKLNGILGVVDGTHVTIVAPRKDES